MCGLTVPFPTELDEARQSSNVEAQLHRLEKFVIIPLPGESISVKSSWASVCKLNLFTRYTIGGITSNDSPGGVEI
jgi:hypothetical protein